MRHAVVNGRGGFRRVGVLAVLVAVALGLGAAPVSAQTAGWSPGPNATGENTYDGYIDFPPAGASMPANQGILLNGWVVDKTAQGWAGIDEVHLYDGRAGEGGTFITRGVPALDRPDVGLALGNGYWAASGFMFAIPPNTLQQGTRTLTVYARSPAKGWWSKQVTLNITRPSYPSDPLTVIEAPVLDEKVLTDNEYDVKGYSLDRNAGPNGGTGVSRVEVWIGQRDLAGSRELTPVSTSLESTRAANYGTQFSKGGWQVRFNPTKFNAGDYFLYVYARSSVTGKESVTSVRFRIEEP